MSDGSNQKDFIENADGSLLLDHKGLPISVEKFLSTKPLRREVSTRQGPGGMKLSYMGGDVITKTLNEAFGYDGWSLEVKDKTQLDPLKDDKGRYIVAFTATVRITHLRTGAFREDCGAGDAIDKSLASASGNALKGAVTDAMKRAARHFGEKLGNSLYHDGFNANKAPNTLKDACENLDLDRAKERFGFEKDRKKMVAAHQQKQQQQQATAVTSNVATTLTTTTSQTTVKGAGPQHSHNNHTKPPPPLYVGGCVAQTQQQTPRLVQSNQPKTTNNNTSKPYVTPHHGMMNSNRTPGNNGIAPSRPTTATSLATTKVNENINPQITTKPGGLNLPKRPGTSRGVGNTNSLGGDDVMKAFYGSSNDVTTANGAPSMFDRGGGISKALITGQQSLKRKINGMDGTTNPIKNPYSQA
eukprot:CAMPEP_0201719812 /NCGR_PEP_ID=MMETSP0593-20130828/4926_1 /ASSEMBLY_ACC=CAM_ASM_000672 /TAXON_ID=267983 /ORGANISM="Skeletonema japonicum, Strain CCMP2506" /LENGTH=413 /DNA_ID=CAMNT_0048210331 /DNA_START=14 /DNA_END=1255 /DNA_ORIENTATION=+